MSSCLSERFWLRIVVSLTAGVAILWFISILTAYVISRVFPHPSSEIAFETDRDGNWEIYVMDIPRGILYNLTRNPADDLGPAWSQQAGKIAFYSDRDADGHTEIYVMGVDGGEVQRVTPESDNNWRPEWSPNGQQIVFIQDYGNIRVMDADGRHEYDLTYGFAPVWSPTDSRIAYYADRRDDLNGEVYLLTADGHNPQNLTHHIAHDWEPAWSPDGQYIAFVSSRDGNADIYIMDAACDGINCGDNVRRLTRNQSTDRAPAWSLDGQQIAFVSEGDNFSQIYIINADGSNMHLFTDVSYNSGSPVWLP